MGSGWGFFFFIFFFWMEEKVRSGEKPACMAPKRMAAPRRFRIFFRVRGKVRGGNNKLLCNESFESCLSV